MDTTSSFDNAILLLDNSINTLLLINQRRVISAANLQCHGSGLVAGETHTAHNLMQMLTNNHAICTQLSICGLNGVKWPTTAAGGVHNNNNIIYIKAKTGTTYSRRSGRSWIHTQAHTHERRGNLRHLWATRSQLKFSFNCDLTFSTSCRLFGRRLQWDGKFPGT